MHIEHVTDLSTAEFVATFRRFVAPRETPVALYSVSGTYFKGFNRFLLEHEDELKIVLHSEEIC